MKLTSLFLMYILLMILSVGKVLGTLVLVEEQRTWNSARDYCKTLDGTLASLQLSDQPEVSRLLESKTFFPWTGSFTIKSPWIENYGCYTSSEYRKQIPGILTSGDCQQLCYNETYFGLKNDVCFCLGTDISALQLSNARNCLICQGKTFDYCGGDDYISVYRKLRIKVNNDGEHNDCLAVQCDRGRSTFQLHYMASACNAELTNVCKNHNSTAGVIRWYLGVKFCVNEYGTLPITYNQTYQRFCHDQTSITTVWTGVFRRLVTTNIKNRPNAVPLQCIAIDARNWVQVSDDCQILRQFICRIDDNKSVIESTTQILQATTNPSSQQDTFSDLECTKATTTEVTEVSTQSVPHSTIPSKPLSKNTGYLVFLIVGIVCVIVVLGVTGILMKQRCEVKGRSINDGRHRINQQTGNYQTLNHLETEPPSTYTRLNGRQDVDAYGYLIVLNSSADASSLAASVSSQREQNYSRTLNHLQTEPPSTYTRLNGRQDVDADGYLTVVNSSADASSSAASVSSQREQNYDKIESGSYQPETACKSLYSYVEIK